MRTPAVMDATVRYLVLTALGVLLLAIVPAASFGSTPAWRIMERPGPTPANLLGIVVIALAWCYFAVVVLALHGAHRLTGVGRLVLVVDVVALVAALVASVYRFDGLVVALLVIATAAQLYVAGLLSRVGVRVRSGEQEAAPSLP